MKHCFYFALTKSLHDTIIKYLPEHLGIPKFLKVCEIWGGSKKGKSRAQNFVAVAILPSTVNCICFFKKF